MNLEQETTCIQKKLKQDFAITYSELPDYIEDVHACFCRETDVIERGKLSLLVEDFLQVSVIRHELDALIEKKVKIT